jgi:hypothetical protein
MIANELDRNHRRDYGAESEQHWNIPSFPDN